MPIEMMPLAALTVMLWLLWSDSIRRGKQLRLFYAVRMLLFGAVSGVVVYNVVKYPEMFGRTGKLMSWIASVVGVVGVAFFFRKLTAPSVPKPQPGPPEGPSLF
ncbi:MAG: hypothetical protein HYU52_12400 [Acidobacteria bacterium]|nr:hypothetical protein [Acidobacteriota bacterium]